MEYYFECPHQVKTSYNQKLGYRSLSSFIWTLFSEQVILVKGSQVIGHYYYWTFVYVIGLVFLLI